MCECPRIESFSDVVFGEWFDTVGTDVLKPVFVVNALCGVVWLILWDEHDRGSVVGVVFASVDEGADDDVVVGVDHCVLVYVFDMVKLFVWRKERYPLSSY